MGVLANKFKREDEMRQLRSMASQNTGVPVTDERIRQANANQLMKALPKNRQLPITPEQQAQIGLPQGYTPQPVQPILPQRNTWNGNKNIVQNIAGGLQNVGADIGNAVVNTVANAPQLVTGMVDSAKQNLTAEGLGNTLPALGRGALQAVDFVPGMAGLVASGINSFAGKDVIPMDNGWHNPVQYTLEQLKDKMDMQKRLQTPVVRPDARIGVAGDNYVYNGKTPNALSQYLVGTNPGADKAQFAEDMVKFGAQMAMGGAGAKLAQGAIKASNLKKAENLQKTVEATKNAEQKAKYAKQLEKLKQAQQQVKKQNDYLQKLKDNTIFGGAVGLTEGENLEERLQSGLGASALGAGGTLAHVGLGKVAKSKPVKSVKGKITNKTNDFINKHHNVANAVGTLSSVMNTDVSSPLAKKYKGLNDVISRNQNLNKRMDAETQQALENAKTIDEAGAEKIKSALQKGLKQTEANYKDIDIKNRQRKGEEIPAEDLNARNEAQFKAIKDRENKTKPKASESNLSEVKQEKGTNTPEEVKTPVKTQSDMSGEAPKKNAEGAYELKAEINKEIKEKGKSEETNDERWKDFYDESDFNLGLRKIKSKFLSESDINKREVNKHRYDDHRRNFKQKYTLYKQNKQKIKEIKEQIEILNDKNINPDFYTRKLAELINDNEQLLNSMRKSAKNKPQKTSIKNITKEQETLEELQLRSESATGTTQSGKWQVKEKQKAKNKLIPKEIFDESKVTQLDPGDAETMQLNELTSTQYEDIYKDVRKANREEAKSFEGKNDALRNDVFIDASTRKVINDAIEPTTGALKDGWEIIEGKTRLSKDGKTRAHLIRQRDTLGQSEIETIKSNAEEGLDDARAKRDYEAYLDEYENEITENGVDERYEKETGVNQNYQKMGWHVVNKVEASEKYKDAAKILNDDGATATEKKVARLFIEFYDKYKKFGNDKGRKSKLYSEVAEKLTAEEREIFDTLASEQLLRDEELSRTKKINSDNKESSEAEQNTQDMFEDISKNEYKEKSEYFNTSNDVLVDATGDASFRFTKLPKRNTSGETAKGDLERIFKNTADKQKAYNFIIKQIRESHNKWNVEADAIRSVNSVAKNYGVKLTHDVKPIVNYTGVIAKTKYKDLDVFEALKLATKTKDISAIKKAFLDNDHVLHKRPRLTSEQKDIISDAYYTEAKDLVDRYKNRDNIAEEEYEAYVASQKAKGKGAYRTLADFKAENLRNLMAERDRLKKILKNSYTDYNLREMKEYNYDYGHGNNEPMFKGKGTVSNADRFYEGLPEQEIVKIERMLDTIEYNAYNERSANKFYNEKDIAKFNDIPDDIVKKYNLKTNNFETERSEIDNKLSENYKKLAEAKKAFKKTEIPGGRTKFADLRTELRKTIKKLNEERSELEELSKELDANKIGYKTTKSGADIERIKENYSRIYDDKYEPTLEDLELVKDKVYDIGGSTAYNDMKTVISKIEKKQALSNKEFDLLDNFQDLMKDTMDVIVDAHKNALSLDEYNKVRKPKYEARQTEKATYAKINDVFKLGKDFVTKLSEVKEGFEKYAIRGILRRVVEGKTDGLTRKEVINKAIDAIKYFANDIYKDRVNYNTIPESLKINKKTGKALNENNFKTTFEGVRLLKAIVGDTDTTISEILGRLDANSVYTILDNRAKTGDAIGNTSTDGSAVWVKYTNRNEFVHTLGHETGHKFLRENVDNNPEAVKRLTEKYVDGGITKEDLIESERVNAEISAFEKTPEGKNWNELYKKYKNNEPMTNKEEKTFNEGAKLYVEYANLKEEIFCDKFGDRFKEISDEINKQETGKFGERPFGRDGHDVSAEVVEGENSRNSGISEEERSSSETRLKTDSKPSNESSTLNDVNIPEVAKSAVKGTINLSDDVFNLTEGLHKIAKKSFDEIGKLKANEQSVYDYQTSRSRAYDKDLIDFGALSSERAQGAIAKFGDSPDAVYYQSFNTKGRNNKFSPKEALSGLFGTKKTKGKSYDPVGATWATAVKGIRIEDAKAVVNYLKENFGEEAKRGKSHPENYVPVNSKVLFSVRYHGLSKQFYETLSKGEKEIKRTFGEDAPEILDWYKRNSKPDMYIPKEVLNKLFDSQEKASTFYNRYIKGRPLSKQTLGLVGKLSGLYLDTVNEQFKKMVLTTSSFFANNRLGNQIMLMARSDRLGDYVKGLYEAAKLKDNEVPKQLLESTLLNAEEMLGSLRRPSGWGKFDAMRNLLDGNMIDTAELKGMKKLGAQAANICLGLPNKGWNAVTRALMKVNENFERFERKQAYSQTLSKAKRENVLTVAQKATAVKEFYKHLDQNKELSDYIIKKAEDVLGDYDNFSPVEKHIFKRLIPFYSWHRTIFRNTLHLIKENPTRAAILALKMYSMLNRDNGREEWQRGANEDIFGIKLPKGIVSNKSSVFPYMTILDDYNKARSLTPFASKSERGTDNPIGDLSPGIRIPVEALKGEKAFAPASEIQDPNWKRVTKDGKKGYFNKNNGKFVTHTPMSVREKYVRRQLIGNTLYPALGNSMFKGLGTALTSGKGKFPDKVYDTTLGGFYDGDYIGEFEGKRKYRSARNNLPLGAQLATRFLGLGLQSDTASQKSSSSDSNKLKKKQQNYKNKRKK